MTEPVRDERGNLENFLIKVAGLPFKCTCGCNVFHKPDSNDLDLYQCNACETKFTAG